MLDEWKLRYKELALWKRLLICALIGLIPAVFLYFDESSVIEEDYLKAESEEKAAANKLVQADNTIKNLSKVESELAFTRDQLKKAESRLPDSIAIDEILRTIGKSAKEFHITIKLFEPKAEILRGDSYKFSELPIKISAEAHDYGQICEWLDHLAGSKSKIYLKSWKIDRRMGKSEGDSFMKFVPLTTGVQESKSIVAERAGRTNRENMRLVLDAELALFKMPSVAQLESPNAPVSDGKTPPKPENKTDDKDTKKPGQSASTIWQRNNDNLNRGAA